MSNCKACKFMTAKGKKRGCAHNAPKFDLRSQLFRMCGVDLTRIDGINVTTALGQDTSRAGWGYAPAPGLPAAK